VTKTIKYSQTRKSDNQGR